MISRTTSFGVGLIFISLAGFAVFAGGDERQLCVNGHPAKRPPDCAVAAVAGCISYGGLSKRSGSQRDHHIPEGLCRGEPWCDQVPNVRYEPWDEARVKDDDEWRIERDYCAGRISLEAARRYFIEHWP